LLPGENTSPSALVAVSTTERQVMTQNDQEKEYLRAYVSCAVVLERMPPIWQLDVKESTRDSLKYRRGQGEIVIVNHDGRGWWDPKSTAKGDVFGLVQHLDPGLNFGAVRRVLRPLAGLAPEFPQHARTAPELTAALLSITQRWAQHSRLTCGSPVWIYLSRDRALPDTLLRAAIVADAIREGPLGSAWFAHRLAGEITGIEMRGPAWRNFSKGGDKTLFRIAGEALQRMRLAVCESAIEALSLAAIEELCPGTLYTGTAGGIGPGTVTALQLELATLGVHPEAVLVAATNADDAGHRYAERLAELARAAGVRFERILPPGGVKDWNDHLRACAYTSALAISA
jgi:Protein of unknown function (DUF3991)/Toprim-like